MELDTIRMHRIQQQTSLSITHAQLLGLFCQLFQGILAFRVLLLSVHQQILKSDTTMRTNHRERKFAFYKQLDQMWARYIQQISRLLRG